MYYPKMLTFYFFFLGGVGGLFGLLCTSKCSPGGMGGETHTILVILGAGIRQEMSAQGVENISQMSYYSMMSDRQWVPGGPELDKFR